MKLDYYDHHSQIEITFYTSHEMVIEDENSKIRLNEKEQEALYDILKQKFEKGTY